MQKEMALALSGLFARTNYGFGMPVTEVMVRLVKNKVTSPRQSMEYFCAQFIESDDHEEMFADEATGWYNQLVEMDVEEARRIWPDHVHMYESAVAQTQK